MSKSNGAKMSKPAAAMFASLYFLYQFHITHDLGWIYLMIVPSLIIGMIIGWIIFPHFLSRSGIYHSSDFQKLKMRLLFGFASGCGIALLTTVLLYYAIH